MNDLKNNSTKNENEKSGNNAGTYNRRKVDSIKRLIILVFLIVCALPILFCLFLMVKMNSMEKKLDELSVKLGSRQQSTVDMSENDGEQLDMMELEQDAYDDLEKNTESANAHLSLTDSNEPDEKADLDEGATGSNSKQQENTKKVYLTFDDGPSIYTGEILDILKANNVKATFFVVHNDDESLWQYYNRIVDEGHTIGMHSYSHVYDTIYASREAFEEDVTMIHDFILEQTGVDSKYYRFPGGSSNSVSRVDIQELMEYLYSRDITYFDWNSLSGDAVNAELSASTLNDTIMGYVRNNAGDSVILMHDLRNTHATVEGLQDLIDTLKSEGYEICPIDENTTPVQHVKYDSND